jgi:hypothetical protein
MFSNRYGRYAIIALLLIGWLSLIDTRNQNNPQVSGITVEKQGRNHLVRCEVRNPRDEQIAVTAILRLVDSGNPEYGVEATASAPIVVKRHIGPHQTIAMEAPIRGIGPWSDAEVHIMAITDPPQIKKIAAR